MKIFSRLFSSKKNEIPRLKKIVNTVNEFEGKIKNLSNEDFIKKTATFKAKIQSSKNVKQTLESILPEAFALVREAAVRTLSMRHFDVQIMGGIVIHEGKVAEMKTGEGKTLVSTLPAYLNALTGDSVHIVTVNDYLAQRDSDSMGKIFNFLGLSVGCVIPEMQFIEKKEAYSCDIIYVTNNELGFDYLRDNMRISKNEVLLNKLNFAIIDEVDSILIDEARTPLIISGQEDTDPLLYKKVNEVILKLKPQHYELEEKEKNAFLTEEGIVETEKEFMSRGFVKKNTSLYDSENLKILHCINQSLKAQHFFKKDVDYIVKDRSVVIVDEFSGRAQEGRRFSNGLHQAIEAKEKVEIAGESKIFASITFQNFFRQYEKLSGMTGTAVTEENEFNKIYNLQVIEIPTNLPITRTDADDEIYKTKDAKYNRALEIIIDCHEKRQPILVGTCSINESEKISKILKKHKLRHNVLNAKQHEKEAHIIAQAGSLGAITIATNMAGRGTDIVLGGNFEEEIDNIKQSTRNDEAKEKKIIEIKNKLKINKIKAIEAGGLYVLGTSRNESRRIDNQLRGRSGRQGDTGYSKFLISMEDDLMRIFGSEKIKAVLSALGLKDDEAIQHKWISSRIEKAQKKIEDRNFQIRKSLLKFDNIVNEQRMIIFKKRKNIIFNNNFYQDTVKEIIPNLIEDVLLSHIPEKSYHHQWELEIIEKKILQIFGLKIDIKQHFAQKDLDENILINFIKTKTIEILNNRTKEIDSSVINEVYQKIVVTSIDQQWQEHLTNLDHLRNSINLRSYGQKDPIMEYKREAFELFENILYQSEEEFITKIFHIEFYKKEDTQRAQRKSSKLKKW